MTTFDAQFIATSPPTINNMRLGAVRIGDWLRRTNENNSHTEHGGEPDYESECKRLKTMVEQLQSKLTKQEDLTKCMNLLINTVIDAYSFEAAKRKGAYITAVKSIRTRNIKQSRRYNACNALVAEKMNFEYECQPDVWVPVTDPYCIDKLFQLVTDVKTTTVTYTIGPHEYCASIVPRICSTTSQTIANIVQENRIYHTHTKRVIRRKNETFATAPLPIFAEPPPPDWNAQLLTGTMFSVFSSGCFSNALKEYSFDPKSEQIVHQSQNIQYLATLFSSFSHNYEYDPSKCELWAKPFALQTFLRAGLTRKYTNARLVMHGSTDYDSLRKDPYSFDIKYSSTTNRYGPGIYCGLTNDVPYHYNKSSGLPDGSGVLGVVLFPDTPSEGHSIQYSIVNMSGKNARGELLKDCCVVRDQMCFLALGLAVAKPRA